MTALIILNVVVATFVLSGILTILSRAIAGQPFSPALAQRRRRRAIRAGALRGTGRRTASAGGAF